MTDKFGRLHNYLRISLTDNCNLRCFYCMPEEDYEFAPRERLMQAHEIIDIAKIFAAQGVNKIRLTGGEPLVRKDAARIITGLGELNVDLAITTNGTRIHEFLDIFKAAKIKTVNVSLDTLQRDKFLLTTRRDQFDLVKKNIGLLISEGFIVKINAVVMKGLNDNEINDFIGWTKYAPIEVRFIEFMPFTGNKWTSNKVFSLEELLAIAANQFDFHAAPGSKNDTAKHFTIPGHAGSFAVISTMTSPFCSTCNRLRLTADGKLKNCLFSESETDLLTPFRNGENIFPLIEGTVLSKTASLGGQFDKSLTTIEALGIHNRSMITIGG